MQRTTNTTGFDVSRKTKHAATEKGANDLLLHILNDPMASEMVNRCLSKYLGNIVVHQLN